MVEYDVLNPSPADVTTITPWGRLVDGVNAVPLAKDAGGGRTGNVEADMLCSSETSTSTVFLLVEVKTGVSEPCLVRRS